VRDAGVIIAPIAPLPVGAVVVEAWAVRTGGDTAGATTDRSRVELFNELRYTCGKIHSRGF